MIQSMSKGGELYPFTNRLQTMQLLAKNLAIKFHFCWAPIIPFVIIKQPCTLPLIHPFTSELSIMRLIVISFVRIFFLERPLCHLWAWMINWQRSSPNLFEDQGYHTYVPNLMHMPYVHQFEGVFGLCEDYVLIGVDWVSKFILFDMLLWW